ncbi:MAG: hypothetical protein GEV03_14225 [Streptosporangiales bacterium]|nr:hypothetical protein [Streptosporangiales bacterium]
MTGVLDARRDSLPDPVRTLHRRILQHFADTGGPPAPDTVRTWSTRLDVDTRDALAQLVTADLVEAEPSAGRVHGAYPFVAQPRGHQVRIDGGPTAQAYCAIDALGVPAMLGRDVTITSPDPTPASRCASSSAAGGPAGSRPLRRPAFRPTTAPGRMIGKPRTYSAPR